MKKATLFNKIKLYFISPKKAFKSESKSKLSEALLYGLFGTIIYSVFAIILLAIFGNEILSQIEEPITPLIWPMLFVVAVILMFVCNIICGLWLHLWAYIFGARKGLANTLKIVFYGNTPQYFIGWLPLIKIGAVIWSLVLYYVGLTELQDLKKSKAIATIIIAIAIPLAIIIALLISILLGYIPLIA